MKVCQNGVVICLAMNCCVSELDIITKLAQRIGLSRRNHDVKYNNSLKTSNGQSEAANRRIDNTEHLISHLVWIDNTEHLISHLVWIDNTEHLISHPVWIDNTEHLISHLVWIDNTEHLISRPVWIDNTEHLISRPVFVGFLLFNLFCVLFCNKMKTKYTTLSEKFKVHKSLYFVVGSVSFVIVLSVT